MTINKFILKGKQSVPCEDLMKWCKWFESADRHVAKSGNDSVQISTVFLGINHQFCGGVPVLFETMIFGGEHHDYQERYETWEQAEKGHKRACKLAGVKP